MYTVKRTQFAFQIVMEWKYKVAENGNTQVTYKYLKILHQYSF